MSVSVRRGCLVGTRMGSKSACLPPRFVCVCSCVCVCVCVCLYVQFSRCPMCMYVCVFVCDALCLYVCMYVYRARSHMYAYMHTHYLSKGQHTVKARHMQVALLYPSEPHIHTHIHFHTISHRVNTPSRHMQAALQYLFESDIHTHMHIHTDSHRVNTPSRHMQVALQYLSEPAWERLSKPRLVTPQQSMDSENVVHTSGHASARGPSPRPT